MNEKSTVKTFSGALEGKKLLVFGTQIYAFIGIPYAEPPIGQLRFSRPKPGIVCFGTPDC
jgi:carboxylesterase type B